MNGYILAQDQTIVIGVDVSDAKHQLAVVNERGNLIRDLTISQPSDGKWVRFLNRRLPRCRVTVVYEAGPHGYELHDLIRALGRAAVVVAPEKHIGVKTDKRDARHIAHDWLAGRAKRVTVPLREKREQRQILQLRTQLQKERTRTSHRISSMLRLHGWGGGALMSKSVLPPALKFCMDQLNKTMDSLRDQIAEIDAELAKMADEAPWRDDVKKLRAIPGVGPLTALEVMLGVADIRAFPRSAAFASYTGLCPGEWSSGRMRRQGSISRQGPGRLRSVLTQAAWTHVRIDPEAKKRFEALAARKGKKKAIVAMARRLAVRIGRPLREPAPQGA